MRALCAGQMSSEKQEFNSNFVGGGEKARGYITKYKSKKCEKVIELSERAEKIMKSSMTDRRNRSNL